MSEVEFVSDLLLAIREGIREGKKSVRDTCYKDYDDQFTGRKLHEKRFRETMDAIGEMTRPDLPKLKFRAARLFYPLFCAVFHMKYGLPKLGLPRLAFKVSDYPKLRIALERVDDLLGKIKAAEAAHEDIAHVGSRVCLGLTAGHP